MPNGIAPKTAEPKASPKAELGKLLKAYLGQRAPPELLEAIDPLLKKQLEANKATPTIAELLVRKIVRLALHPTRGHQWAVELIFDRVEGKAVQGLPQRTDPRQLDEHLDSITTEHLNSLAVEFVHDAERELARQDVTSATAGPASKILDLPRDGSGRSQTRGGEPAVEEETEAARAAG